MSLILLYERFKLNYTANGRGGKYQFSNTFNRGFNFSSLKFAINQSEDRRHTAVAWEA
jgi:hypothetical protein